MMESPISAEVATKLSVMIVSTLTRNYVRNVCKNGSGKECLSDLQ